MTLKSWADVDRLTDDLEAIADWQDDLRSTIARALTRFELVDSVMPSGTLLLLKSRSSSASAEPFHSSLKGRRHERADQRATRRRSNCP